MFNYSIILSITTSFIGMLLLVDETSIWTIILTFLTTFLSCMATTSLCEIFKQNHSGKIYQSLIFNIFINYGIHFCSALFSLIINLFVATLYGTMGMFSMMLGDSGIYRLFEFIWLVTSIIVGVTFTLSAYPEESMKIIKKIEEKLKKSGENKELLQNDDTKKKRYCNYCNNEVTYDTKFCSNCGKEISK